MKTVPVLWAFTYKIDTSGYLTKFKARLCVRGDLQESAHEGTYAAIAISALNDFAARVAA